MKLSHHFMFWFAIWGIMFLASPLLLATDGQVVRIKSEVSSIRSVFGDLKTDEIVGSASTSYQSMFIKSGILTEQNKLYTKQAEPGNRFSSLVSKPSQALSSVSNGYLRALSINVYGIMVRWGIILHWLLFIFPFIAAAFSDGFVTRKIKFTEFGFISPMAYSMSLHLIVFMLFVPLLYLVAPLPVTPYFMPGWAMLMALPINLMVANTQRLFNG
jgi:hypothetical protein